MTRNGITVFACSTAMALAIATSAVAAERSHDDLTPPTASGDALSSPGTPRTYSEYAKLIKDGGAVAGSRFLSKSTVLGPNGAHMIYPDGKSSLTGACDRTPFVCGLYLDDEEAGFDTEQGPFSRALGNYEDFELGNAPPGGLCFVSNMPLDCSLEADTAAGCGTSFDAGDVLKGLTFNNTPAHGFAAGQYAVFGAGFTGTSGKNVMPNYFGDTHTVTFPNAAAPVGCQTLSPGPEVVGMRMTSPGGSQPGATITVTLKDGTKMVIDDAPIPANGKFLGICCPSEIKSIDLNDKEGNVIALDAIKWGQTVGACPITFPPVTLEDIDCEIQAIEAKLDAGVGGGGSSCNVCVSELEALGSRSVRNGLEAKRDSACRAKARGQIHTAENIMCAFLSSVGSQEGKALTTAEADALRTCAGNSGIDTSSCTK